MGYDLDVGTGQSPADEVQRFDYFAGSLARRTSRRNTKFRIGQVFKHRKYDYKGVIVGWDDRGKAPDDWFSETRTGSWYSVLVEDGSKRYVTERNIMLITNTQAAASMTHPDMGQHFTAFSSKMN